PGGFGGGAGGFLRRLDANGDGRIEKGELTDERMSPLFERLDANKDGVIDEDELRAAQQRMGRPGTPPPGAPGQQQNPPPPSPGAERAPVPQLDAAPLSPASEPRASARAESPAGTRAPLTHGDTGTGATHSPQEPATLRLTAADERHDDQESSQTKGDDESQVGRSGERRAQRRTQPEQGERGNRFINVLKQSDANGDGLIQRDEMPERVQGFFDRMDENSDGAIDAAELDAAAERMRQMFGGRREGGPDSPPQQPGQEPAKPAATSEERAAQEPVATSPTEPPTTGQSEAATVEAEPESESDAPPAVEPSAAEPASQEAQTHAAEEAQAAAAPSTTGPAAAPEFDLDSPIAGEWAAEVRSSRFRGAGGFTIAVKVTKEGKLGGSYTSRFGSGMIVDGSFNAESKSFTIHVQDERGERSLSGTIDGKKMTGVLEAGGGMFTVDFEAQRTRSGAQLAAAEAQEEAARYEFKPLEQLIPGPRWVSSIETSRFNEKRVYLTLDGHRSNDDEPYVFVSEDHGKTWRSIRANLPTSAGTTRVIREDVENENLLFLGAEFSAWASIDRGQSWTRLNHQLPTVAVHEFAIHPTSGEVVAATHGRSLWIMDATPLRRMSTETVAAKFHLYDPPPAIYWRGEPSRGGAARFVGQNPPDGARINYSINERPQRFRLQIVNWAGDVIHTFDDARDEEGLHEVRWDLRTEPGGPDRAPAAGPPGGFRGFGPRGRLVESGKYVVALTYNDQTVRKELIVQTDPEYPDYRPWETQERDEAFDAWMRAIEEEDDNEGDLVPGW
ncbi:MAG: hypothetical protein C4558_08000, partial [Dehalococcoidia bacterium]